MPEISRFLGILIYMNWMDHPRPHFHARYGSYEILVEIETGVVRGDFPKRALRAVLDLAPAAVQVGATWCNERVLVVRALAPLAEPLAAVFRGAWATLRRQAWGLGHEPPRIWSV